MGIMDGKRGLIMGVANKQSMAWGIAQACAIPHAIDCLLSLIHI